MTVSSSSSDIELMKRVSEFDSKALEVLYNRYSPLLYSLIKKITDNKEIAEEILTEVFAIIWKKNNLFDYKTNDVYTWLVSLSRNKAIDIVKRERNPDKFPEYNDEYENRFIIPYLSKEIDTLDLKTVQSIKDNFDTALNNLTEAQQYVLFLAYYTGLNENEIAAKLNIPLPTVKSKIKLALNNLRTNLVKEAADGK